RQRSDGPAAGERGRGSWTPVAGAAAGSDVGLEQFAAFVGAVDVVLQEEAEDRGGEATRYQHADRDGHHEDDYEDCRTDHGPIMAASGPSSPHGPSTTVQQSSGPK